MRGNVNWMNARRRTMESDAAGARPRQDVAADPARPVRHRHARQRPRAAAGRRLSARPRDDDADPRGLGRQSADGRQAPGLLRVPRRADGAVGRAGRHRLHRRPPGRRHARPQRPAAGALHHHRPGPRDHGLGGRRAGRSRRSASSASGACSPGKMLLIDMEEGRIVEDEEIKATLAARRALRRVAAADPVQARGPARAAAVGAGAGQRPGRLARSPAGVRLHPGGPRLLPRADERGRRRPGRLDGHGHAAGGALATARACSTTISSRTSPRSPTRRSTRSARSW